MQERQTMYTTLSSLEEMQDENIAAAAADINIVNVDGELKCVG